MSFERSIVRAFEKYTFPTGSFWFKSLGLPPIKWLKPANLDSLENMQQTTGLIERGHLAGFVGLGIYSFGLALHNETMGALTVMGLNLLGNLPPVLVNHHNQTRLNHAIKRGKNLELRERLKNYAWSQPKLDSPNTQEEIDDWVFELMLRETKEKLSLAA